MLVKHIWGVMTHPEAEWKAIRDERCTATKCFCSHVMVLALLPAVAGYIGTTQVGWQVGGSEVVKLTGASALKIALAFYATMLVAVFTIGKMIQWMARTYGSQPTFAASMALSAYTATPLFLLGLFLLYPIPWLNFIVGLPALAYTVYLLYTGLPIMMNIPLERGFLFSSAVLAVGLVMLVGLLAATVVLWEWGLGPAFTD